MEIPQNPVTKLIDFTEFTMTGALLRLSKKGGFALFGTASFSITAYCYNLKLINE
jgi:hypothetical protein